MFHPFVRTHRHTQDGTHTPPQLVIACRSLSLSACDMSPAPPPPCKAALTRCGRRRLGGAAGGVATARWNSAHYKQNPIARPYPTPYAPPRAPNPSKTPQKTVIFSQQHLYLPNKTCTRMHGVCVSVMEHWQHPY